MKKTLISLMLMFMVSIVFGYTNEPTQVIGIHKGQAQGFNNIKITSSVVTCLISTGTENIVPLTDWIIKNDEDNSSNAYLSTSTKFVSCVATIISTNNAVFQVPIATTTLVSGTTIWTTNGISQRNVFTNLTTIADFALFGSTAIVVGTVTISGLDDTYQQTSETIFINQYANTGSKIWVDISTISINIQSVTVGVINRGLALNNAIIKIGVSNSTSNKTVGNVWILHPGESISVGGQVRDGIPIFAKTVELGGTCTMCIMKTEYSH
jgi:hypothetical protein